MGEFKVIYRIDSTNATPEIKWEEGCPLLLDALQISRDTDTGEAFLQSRFRNISGQKIESFSVEFTVQYDNGERETLNLDPLDADIFPGEKYDAKPFELSAGDAVSVEVKTESAKQSLNEWVSSCPASAIPKPDLLSLSSVALEERSIELREMGCRESGKASHYAIGRHDGWTLCPCGQINVGISFCVSCGLHFDDLSNECSEEYFARAAADRRVKRAEQEKLRDERRRENRKQWIRRIPLLILVMGFASLLFGAYQAGYLGGEPQAERLEKEHQERIKEETEKAVKTFAKCFGNKVTGPIVMGRITEVENAPKYNDAEIMGLSGTIEFEDIDHDRKVDGFWWKSEDDYNKKEVKAFIASLNTYFGDDIELTKSELDMLDYHEPDRVWRDDRTDCYVGIFYNDLGDKDDIRLLWLHQ